MLKPQCKIKGKLLNYDACASGSLTEAKEFHGKSFKYIGSAKTIYWNGKRENQGEAYHFFVKTKNKK